MDGEDARDIAAYRVEWRPFTGTGKWMLVAKTDSLAAAVGQAGNYRRAHKGQTRIVGQRVVQITNASPEDFAI